MEQKLEDCFFFLQVWENIKFRKVEVIKSISIPCVTYEKRERCDNRDLIRVYPEHAMIANLIFLKVFLDV